jgi:hypothetical protein
MLREEYRPGMFEKWVLRRVFRPKGDQITGGLKKICNQGLHNP